MLKRLLADRLLVAGWVLFDAGSTYGVVRMTAVENWPRVFTRPMREDLSKVAAGTCEFSEHEHLFWPKSLSSDGQTNDGDDEY